MELIEALAIKKGADKSVFRKPNVVASGIGFKNGDPAQGLAIIASVIEKKPAGLKKGHVSSFQRIPKTFDGLQSDVIETGPIYALQGPTGRWRPAIPGGVSIGHYKITAGTLGAWVNYDGKKVILSNNHVLANSNDAILLDHILQPGGFDGGKDPQDYVAKLTKFIPMHFEGQESDCDAINMIVRTVNFCSRNLGRKSEIRSYVTERSLENLVDCAIAAPLSDEFVKDELIDGTRVKGWAHLNLGDYCHKFGRTTGHTEGTIQQIKVTVMVAYGTAKYAKFVDQLMAGAMSDGGDSGSIVLNKENKAGGLLFAGSQSTTIINPIEKVIEALGISF